MKRALLIAGGTVGGLGAVLAITPPQLSTTSSINIAGGSAIGTTGTGSSASASSSSSAPVASAAATNSAKPAATKKGTATQPAATQSATATPSATTTTAAPAASTVKDGTFTGPSVYVNYGNVQVQITVVNGRITDAVAVKAPSGKNDRYTNMSVPVLKQQTLKAQSANIQGVSGASYTSYGWFTSLQGALTAAGL
jgi:uncharacterized protein with FMN-binding domain